MSHKNIRWERILARCTSEQQDVIHHPLARHARVLAVAGSGKTSTMVLRVRHLVMNQEVNPAKLTVLMYNTLARRDFQAKLLSYGIPAHLQPPVHTFHSFCYQFIRQMIEKGVIPKRTQIWTEDKVELVRIKAHEAIRNVARSLDADEVDVPDVDEALDAIGLWKGSLIPPSRAGYHGNPLMALVYNEFEQLRNQANALTFDDFVPLAVDLLETVPALSQAWCNRMNHVIVDEYQDVNYGQQRLIELVAGQRADVMVVGDDDQTIYEWRGARPTYILREFKTVFSRKPHSEYTLSRSFRFGPTIAQCAQNLISFNTHRASKPLVAHFIEKPAQIEIISQSSAQPTDVDKVLTDQIQTLLSDPEIRPDKDIVVLARMYAQLAGLEREFLVRKIPYHVYGHAPFFERRELRVLLNYVRIGQSLNHPLSEQIADQFLSIANTPSRQLRREVLSRALQGARAQRLTLQQTLVELVDNQSTTLNRSQRDQCEDLRFFLERIHERLAHEPRLLCGELLTWLVDSLNYFAHFDNYFGRGEHSNDRKLAVRSFVDYATSTGLRPLEFMNQIANANSTQGVPEERQVRMTTIFKTKGLEYTHVFIPQCDEGYMPCLYAQHNRIYDTGGQVKEPELSEAVENERRLFYVAMTRAKRAVYIGTSARSISDSVAMTSLSSRFLEEMQHEPVVGVVPLLQKVADGDSSAKPLLLSNIKKYGGYHWVQRQLVPDYVVGLSDSTLTGDVMNIISGISEKAFSYQYAYPVLPTFDQDAEEEDPLPF